MDSLGRRSAQELSALARGAFVQFQRTLERNRIEFERQGIRPSGLFERLLGLQLFLSGAVSDKHLADRSKGRAQDSDEILAEEAILSMVGHNIRYLFSAMRALEQDLATAYDSLVRPVVESIPKSFYLMARPHEIKEFMVVDMYSGWQPDNPRQRPRDSVDEFLRLPEPQELLGKKLTANKFDDIRKKCSNKRIRGCLYDDEALKVQTDVYAALSASAHASMFRPFPVRREPARSERFANITVELSFFNLFLLVNSQSRTLKDLGLMDWSAQVVLDAVKDLGQVYQVANLYPDNAEYTKNLEIRLELTPRPRSDAVQPDGPS